MVLLVAVSASQYQAQGSDTYDSIRVVPHQQAAFYYEPRQQAFGQIQPVGYLQQTSGNQASARQSNEEPVLPLFSPSLNSPGTASAAEVSNQAPASPPESIGPSFDFQPVPEDRIPALRGRARVARRPAVQFPQLGQLVGRKSVAQQPAAAGQQIRSTNSAPLASQLTPMPQAGINAQASRQPSVGFSQSAAKPVSTGPAPSIEYQPARPQPANGVHQRIADNSRFSGGPVTGFSDAAQPTPRPQPSAGNRPIQTRIAANAADRSQPTAIAPMPAAVDRPPVANTAHPVVVGGGPYHGGFAGQCACGHSAGHCGCGHGGACCPNDCFPPVCGRPIRPYEDGELSDAFKRKFHSCCCLCKYYNCRSTCNMYPHYPYYPANHGYYYFRPYNFMHVAMHQSIAPILGEDPASPYAGALLNRLYADLAIAAYDEPVIADESLNPTPRQVAPPLPDLQKLLETR
jgi:hypothetical protein